MSRRGLPAEKRMRHDAHYIDDIIGSRATTTLGRYLPITAIEPNPQQPRTEIGDLTELIASVKDKGVLEPLLVQPRETGKWMIIAGERRWRAATAAGLDEVPCIELDVDDKTVAEIALIENLQRKDLTPWEEAEGLLALCQRFGYTHEEVAQRVGKSRSSITEAMSIAALPIEVKEKCRGAGVFAKSTLLQIARQPNDDEMYKMVEVVTQGKMTREQARAARRTLNGEESRPKPFTFKLTIEEKIKLQIESPEALSVEQLESVLKKALALTATG